MALDTALKRASALNIASSWRGILPLPDGTVNQADRQVVPFFYSGISAASLVTVPDVVGDVQVSGTLELEAAGFVVAVTFAYSSSVQAGLIISQDPSGGSEAALGSTVTITVSLGDSARPAGVRKRKRLYMLPDKRLALADDREIRELFKLYEKVEPVSKQKAKKKKFTQTPVDASELIAKAEKLAEEELVQEKMRRAESEEEADIAYVMKFISELYK